MAMLALYFGITMLLLGGIVIDWLGGTSLTEIVADWVIEIKLVALAAALLWGVFLSGPAALAAWLLGAPSENFRWRARPIVGALALNAMLLAGYEAWDHMPRPDPWPPEFIVPRTDIYGPRLAVLRLRILALECMEDATPAHCQREDIKRIEVEYYLKWLDENPHRFEGPRSWG
jgi:hypothetical protein